MSGEPRSIPLSDDELFPATAFFEIGLEKFRREALAPLNIEFLSLAELSGKIFGEVQPETA